MSDKNHYDVIIIGTGAGGGTLARNSRPPASGSCCSSAATMSRAKRTTGARARSTFKGSTRPRRSGATGTGILCTRTPTTASAATRNSTARRSSGLRREDFGTVKHHGGVSPAWPITYDELEPYYTQAEQHYHVHGERGEDPTDPPASGPYPHPAVSHEPRIQQLSDDFAAAGLRPFHTPLGVSWTRRTPHASKCIRCNTCDGFPCLVYAKSDAQVLGVDPALEYPNVTLMTNAYVERLETSASGREVTERRGRARTAPPRRYSADIVVVSCGAINSAALLLRSANDKHPRGLANGSDVVGRHYMGHVNSVLMAVSKCPNPTVFQKTLSVNDFYFGSDDWQYPDGAHLLRRQAGRRHV